MKKSTKYCLILGLTLLLPSCADSASYVQNNVSYVAGFWHGLWHGMLLPFSFIVSLFDKDVAIYAINNSGSWYDFGFVLGTGGAIRSARYSKRS